MHGHVFLNPAETQVLQFLIYLKAVLGWFVIVLMWILKFKPEFEIFSITCGWAPPFLLCVQKQFSQFYLCLTWEHFGISIHWFYDALTQSLYGIIVTCWYCLAITSSSTRGLTKEPENGPLGNSTQSPTCPSTLSSSKQKSFTCFDAGAAVFTALVALRTAVFPIGAGDSLWGVRKPLRTSHFINTTQNWTKCLMDSPCKNFTLHLIN